MQTTETFQRVKQATADACVTAARTSRDAVGRGVGYVRRNPIKVLLGAVAVGALVAWAVHSRRTTWQERTFSLPVKKLRLWAGSAAERAGDTLEDYKDRALEVAGDAVGAMQKGASKLRFWS